MYIDRKDSLPNGYQSGNSHCSKNSYTDDALGSVIALTDETGAIKTQYIYDPYGNTTIIGEVNDNPFQYTGRENDGDGLLYYRARYYSPEMQRFTREDPIRFKGGDVNFFAYVGNNPVNRRDPSGKGPFGPKCGPKGSVLATYIPDISPDWCDVHDKCYDECAKKCGGHECKRICDYELASHNPIYGSATLYFGNSTYDALERKNGCCQ